MHVHGGIPLGDAWGYLRDHAKGTTPYANDQLAECRTYTAPSKAHLKRVQRERPEISKARKPLPPVERKVEHELVRLARESQRLIRASAYQGR